MAEVRIDKLLRQFNVSLDDLLDFLKEQGISVGPLLNAKISDELLPSLNKRFGQDPDLADADNQFAAKNGVADQLSFQPTHGIAEAMSKRNFSYVESTLGGALYFKRGGT